jgi:4-amino-4-deoxy-L-arabinose transferase-like glycosyltransferase
MQSQMKRVFWSPILALVSGAALRLLFVLKFPGGSGDTVIYDQLATNWLKHGKYAMDIASQPVPVDIRMPGYPAFLAVVYALTGHTGDAARRAVMFAQVFVDLATCVVIAALAALLACFWLEKADSLRISRFALWLAALCPFTANYVAVPLTEVWAVFFTAWALLSLAVVFVLAAGVWLPFVEKRTDREYWLAAAATGFVVGLGTLFRPETPLLLAIAFLALAFILLRQRQPKRLLLSIVLMTFAAALPLVPWAIRNAITLHEFQPLAPKNTMLPGELDPQGFMAWERTWLYRVRDCYLVTWKLNDEAIVLDDIPSFAFDTPDERERVAAVLETYNDELTLTSQEDAVFAELASERTARHPLRTYLTIPLRRAVRIWFTPRIELLPVSGHVFPLAYMWEEDPLDQRVTILIFLLNVVYVGLGVWGAWRLWRYPAARPVVSFLVVYFLARTAFLTTLEAPEPRYVLVCFPALVALAAQIFLRQPRRS